ncbi:LacI family DNA-binding transcriptional regulator [Rhizocola hellebori]|uniref:LacI family DNA-binding transcriptional regulator n=1 Tax=Rhizocola hellebori TaxID=1392758 RepID=UPI001EF3CBE8|nr:LacI family DNA-binding transcriptional regulator [Rhizocola hellebori]
MQGGDSAKVRGADPARRGRLRGELTVATIARLAGVSAPTVSRVLNGRSDVAEDTRRRVEQLLREHGYRRPGAILPSPGIEVIFYGLESNLAIEMMRGVQGVVTDHDLGVGFTEVMVDAPVQRSWCERMLARRPTGVIIVHSLFTAEQHAQLAASSIPLVAADPNGQPHQPVPSVGAANWGGAVAATRHLLELGHRRIGVIGGPGVSLYARERLEACRAALEIARVPLDPGLVRTGEFSFEAGLGLGSELLSQPDPPTAVLCGNDLQALGVYKAARRLGLHIPRDLSVVGFDGIDAGTWCDPLLTTVRQPFRDIGAAAANLLLALIAGPVPAQTRIELPASLLVRESTAPPPA